MYSRSSTWTLLPLLTFLLTIVSPIYSYIYRGYFYECADFGGSVIGLKRFVHFFAFIHPLFLIGYLIYRFETRIDIKKWLAVTIDTIAFVGFLITLLGSIFGIFVLFLSPSNLNDVDPEIRVEKERELGCCYAYEYYPVYNEEENDDEVIIIESNQAMVACECPMYVDNQDEQNNNNDEEPDDNSAADVVRLNSDNKKKRMLKREGTLDVAPEIETCPFEIQKEDMCCFGIEMFVSGFYVIELLTIVTCIVTGISSIYGYVHLQKTQGVFNGLLRAIGCKRAKNNQYEQQPDDDEGVIPDDDENNVLLRE